jgi:hypothetical protein
MYASIRSYLLICRSVMLRRGLQKIKDKTQLYARQSDSFHLDVLGSCWVNFFLFELTLARTSPIFNAS